MNKKTNKTAQVLKMLTKSQGSIENPIINQEFKEEVIHTRAAKQKNKADHADSHALEAIPVNGNDIGINIVEELVQEWLPETIKRFNCCDTDVYIAELTVQALNILPPKYVYIKNENDYANVKNIKDKYKKKVINTLVHLAITSKNASTSKRIS